MDYIRNAHRFIKQPMKRFFFAALLLTCIVVTAQNRVFILQPGDSIGSTLTYSKDNEWGRFDYHVPPTPPAAYGAFPFEANFHNLANNAVSDFQLQHLDG